MAFKCKANELMEHYWNTKMFYTYDKSARIHKNVYKRNVKSWDKRKKIFLPSWSPYFTTANQILHKAITCSIQYKTINNPFKGMSAVKK